MTSDKFLRISRMDDCEIEFSIGGEITIYISSVIERFWEISQGRSARVLARLAHVDWGEFHLEIESDAGSLMATWSIQPIVPGWDNEFFQRGFYTSSTSKESLRVSITNQMYAYVTQAELRHRRRIKSNPRPLTIPDAYGDW